MACGFSDYNKTIREGPVKIIHENKTTERKYLKAICGSSGDCSARLEIYEDYRSEKLMIRRISFTDVKNVGHTEERHGAIITIKMLEDDKTFLFYADSQQSTMKWYRYCSLLFKIPKCDIPEIPKENIVLRQPTAGIDRYGEMHKCDTANKWVVNILSEEIGGRVIGLFKLCVVTICHKTSTLIIYGFYTGKNSLTWQRDGIKRSGCIESLVFLEVDETCRGGPGLLWMECPVSQSAKLQKHIHEFLLAGHEEQKSQNTPPSSPAGYVFVDSVTNSSIHSKGDQELSQISYEDQVSDTLSSVNTPISQSGTSLSSDLECSSGYCSDNSITGRLISSNISQLSFPKGAFKLLPVKDLEEREQGIHDNFTAPLIKQPVSTQATAAAKIRNDKLICSSNSSLENGLAQMAELTTSTNSNKNALQSKVKLPSVSSRSCNKETSSTRIPRPPSSRSTSISKSHHSAATVTPPTVQDDELPLRNCSPLKQEVAIDSTSKHRLEKIAFQKCSVIIVENLDISVILPHLNSKGLLTTKDRQTLINRLMTTTEKAQYLLEVLPRKNRGSLEKFKECLRETQYGTGHGDILRALSESYNQKIKERNSQVDASQSPDVTLKRSAKKTCQCHSMAKK